MTFNSEIDANIKFQGDPANVIIAADDELVQLSLNGAGVNRHAAAQV